MRLSAPARRRPRRQRRVPIRADLNSSVGPGTGSVEIQEGPHEPRRDISATAARAPIRPTSFRRSRLRRASDAIREPRARVPTPGTQHPAHVARAGSVGHRVVMRHERDRVARRPVLRRDVMDDVRSVLTRVGGVRLPKPDDNRSRSAAAIYHAPRRLGADRPRAIRRARASTRGGARRPNSTDAR